LTVIGHVREQLDYSNERIAALLLEVLGLEVEFPRRAR